MPFDIKSIFSKNFINLTLNQGVNIIATLIYTPILFQILGEENFGLIQLAFSSTLSKRVKNDDAFSISPLTHA